MSKTEVVIEKRLFAMRHNPAMRMELEGRATDALKERAAAQAEVAAVSRAREEEAAARKAQLVGAGGLGRCGGGGVGRGRTNQTGWAEGPSCLAVDSFARSGGSRGRDPGLAGAVALDH